jgi:hypothetical protein
MLSRSVVSIRSNIDRSNMCRLHNKDMHDEYDEAIVNMQNALKCMEAKKKDFAAYQMADIKSGEELSKGKGKKRARGLVEELKEELGEEAEEEPEEDAGPSSKRARF